MDNKKTVEEFGFKFCSSFLEDGATYSSIILTKDCSVLYSYSTSNQWDRLYHESGYSKSCHLIQATKILSQTNSNFTLFWDMIKPNNEISIYLNDQRKDKNICHGVSFCKKNVNGVLEIVTLTGRHCDFNFATQAIKNKNDINLRLLKFEEKYLSEKAS